MLDLAFAMLVNVVGVALAIMVITLVLSVPANLLTKHVVHVGNIVVRLSRKLTPL